MGSVNLAGSGAIIVIGANGALKYRIKKPRENYHMKFDSFVNTVPLRFAFKDIKPGLYHSDRYKSHHFFLVTGKVTLLDNKMWHGIYFIHGNGEVSGLCESENLEAHVFTRYEAGTRVVFTQD